jgi:hypothetical protein
MLYETMRYCLVSELLLTFVVLLMLLSVIYLAGKPDESKRFGSALES